MGPRKTLRLVAKYGDACNFFGASEIGVLKERLEILQRHCEEVSRPYQEIEKTVLQTADLEAGGKQDIIARAKTLQEIGFEHIIFNIKGLYSPQTLKLFTHEIIPALKG